MCVTSLTVQDMQLAHDYIHRAEVRLRALDLYLEAGSWADVNQP